MTNLKTCTGHSLEEFNAWCYPLKKSQNEQVMNLRTFVSQKLKDTTILFKFTTIAHIFAEVPQGKEVSRAF